MNWIVRLKNPVFWVTVIPAFVGLVYTLLRALGIVPGIAQDEIEGLVGTVIMALTTLGVLVDPTTAGLEDSARARTYCCPTDSDNQYEEEMS